MKVYTRVVIDIESGRFEEEDEVRYDGPVALCKGYELPKMPKLPKPPPLPLPPDMKVSEEKKKQEYLDKLLLRSQKSRAWKFGPTNNLGIGSTIGTAVAQGQPKTLLGG